MSGQDFFKQGYLLTDRGYLEKQAQQIHSIQIFWDWVTDWSNGERNISLQHSRYYSGWNLNTDFIDIAGGLKMLNLYSSIVKYINIQCKLHMHIFDSWKALF